MRGLITHKDYEIEFFEYGNGSHIIFAFHGFNNHAEDFKAFGEIAGNEYKVVAINLFFHGDSHAHTDIVERGFSIDDLKKLFDSISALFPAEKYTLMGYSLGGRIVLKLLEIYPEKIEKIILIAPDGIRISPLYRYLTQFTAGQTLFKRVADNPTYFFVLARLIKSFRIVGEKKYAFAINNFDTKQKREKIFLVWMIFRRIISEGSKIKDVIKKYNIPVHLFFGKHDKIIPPSIGIRFQKGMEKYVTLNTLDSGHRLLKENTLKEIAEILAAKR